MESSNHASSNSNNNSEEFDTTLKHTKESHPRTENLDFDQRNYIPSIFTYKINSFVF